MIMKTFTLLIPMVTLCGSLLCARSPESLPSPEPAKAHTQAPAPAAGKVAADLFWVADSRKMDQFLARVQLPDLDGAAGSGEVLPDTRTAWRDYAREARSLAQQGRVADAAGRLAQMLKLAAVYRAFGGLENTVQSEEIRYLAGLTAETLGSGVTASIRSPYLEKNAAQCLAQLDSGLGGGMSEITASFWKNLTKRALETYARLSQAGDVAKVATP